MAGQDGGHSKGFGDPRYRALMERLTVARKEAGLSQLALAAKMGRHQQFVSRYETGERRLDVVEFMDVAKALGTHASTMLDTLS